jgi:RecA/RadA recombinase
MQPSTTQIPPLYRYNISKLPSDIFVDLRRSRTCTSTTTSNDDAQQLQYEIVYKLKQISTPNIRISTTTSLPTISTATDTVSLDRITTVAKLLQLSPYGIFHRLDPILTLNECIRLYQRICIHCTPNCKSAFSLLSTSKWSSLPLNENLPQSFVSNHIRCSNYSYYISTGWDTLDQTLHGGLRIGTITELMGCAGTGKTQLALQTTITTAVHQNDHSNENDQHNANHTNGGGTIWIDTEQKISLLRLQEMTISRCRSNQGNTDPENVYTVLENVTIHSPSHFNEFINILDSLEDEIVERNAAAAAASHTSGSVSSSQQKGKKLPVRLIVIDSIAAAIRRESTTSTTTAQQQAICMMQVAQLLKRYADQYSIAILIINQTTSTTTIHTFPSRSTKSHYQQQHQRAALGTAWHHCVTTRIELQQQDTLDHDHHQHMTNSTNDQIPHRHAKIVKSLTVEPTYSPLPFQITTHGIVDCVRKA